MSGSPGSGKRIAAIDAARGIAIALMVLSHTVKGLMPFKMMPDFGIVPVHLITKVSSSLFFMVFGISMAVVFFGKCSDAGSWPAARWKLIWRGLLIMASYKALTVVQMFERSDWPTIVDALTWVTFPDYVEVLQFYGFILLVLPWLVPALSRLSVGTLLFLAWMLGLGSQIVRESYEFEGIWQLQAVLVEHPSAFCFGLLPRGGFVLFGMAIGQALRSGDPLARRREVGQALVTVGAAALFTFFATNWESLESVLVSLAKNWGKHPPNLPFVLFSLGGAVLVAGALFLLPNRWHWALGPFSMLGRESLLCFNLHILVIFIGFRSWMGLRLEVSYSAAIGLTLINLVICGLAAWAWGSLKRAWGARRRKRAPVEECDEHSVTEPAYEIGREG